MFFMYSLAVSSHCLDFASLLEKYMKIPYRITPTSITVMINGRTHVVTRDSTVVPFDQLAQAIKDEDFDTVQSLIDPKTSIVLFTEGLATITEDGTVKVDGVDLHPVLVDRMKFLIREGYDFKPLARFIANLAENPIASAVNELFLFLEKCDLAITDDGHFIAYKKVNSSYRDIYSDSIDNSVGCYVSVPETEVDTNRDATCSRGLHFCSESYLSHYGSADGDHVVLVKINPKDVRAIPSDYSNAKGRATAYLVIGEVGTEMSDMVKTKAVVTVASGESTGEATTKVGLRKEATVTKIVASGNLSEQARAQGFLVNGQVKILDGKAVKFNTTRKDAVVRSWETKSVKAAVKLALSVTVGVTETVKTKIAAPVATAPKFTGATFTRAEIMELFLIEDSMQFDRMRISGSKFIPATGGMYRII